MQKIICNNELNSEDYTEFIFRNSYFASKLLDSVADYCVTGINDKWFIVSVRNGLVGRPSYENYGYSVFPGIYGISDANAINKAGVAAIREQPRLNLRGNGTLVAIIDTGINWQHKAFIDGGVTSKIEVIWDQTENKIYDNDMINNAINNGMLDIPMDYSGHGTFLAGLACGNADPANSFSGVATDARLIIVRLRKAKNSLKDFYRIKRNVIAFSESDIMLGIAFASDYADNLRRPLSIILGVGTSLGAHYGYSPLSELIRDEAQKVGRCISISAGNEGNERLHFHGKTSAYAASQTELKIGSNEVGFTANIWYKPQAFYNLIIVSPSGQSISKIPILNKSTDVNFIFENTRITVYGKQFESLTGAGIISLRFDKPAEGIWTIELINNSSFNSEYDIWLINRNFISEDTFFLTSSPNETILNPGNTVEAITVGAYNYRDDSLYFRSSRGNNWYGFVKPDFVAPGVDIIGPSAFNDNGYELRSGSSIATAIFGGMAALLLEYGIVKGAIPYIKTSEIRSIIISGCEQKNTIKYPNSIWGYGIVNLYNSLENIKSI